MAYQRQEFDAGKDKVPPRRMANRPVVRQILIALTVSTLMMMAFNSADLAQVARGLRIGPFENALVRAAEGWHSLMRRAGLDAAADAVREFVRRGEDAAWPDLEKLTQTLVGQCAREDGLRGALDPADGDAGEGGHDFAPEKGFHFNPACYLRRLTAG